MENNSKSDANNLVRSPVISSQEKLRLLNFACQNYNPYLQNNLPEVIDVLAAFGIDIEKENPFYITNKLLVLLDQLTEVAQEEINL
ncbi:MAG: hypothetical protein HQK50_05885 [Oligoflexia bacterium]|nr:hypothetical protein [Oligoflexia bacterium]MBF0365081.1 hypothetical protein [Oligoflexia bacterium]